jgi:hypothetical protein
MRCREAGTELLDITVLSSAMSRLGAEGAAVASRP